MKMLVLFTNHAQTTKITHNDVPLLSDKVATSLHIGVRYYATGKGVIVMNSVFHNLFCDLSTET